MNILFWQRQSQLPDRARLSCATISTIPRSYYTHLQNEICLKQTKGIESGAEAYITKPFNVEYLENPDFSVELLSNLLGYSSRQFYRKLKAVTDKSPNEIIREFRLTVAERLLLTTQLSIDEIMYKTGYANRGTFYKVFAQRFEMTPKQYRTLKQGDVQGAMEEKE